MNLGTFLVLVAAILAIIEMAASWRVANWAYHWILGLAVLLVAVGVLLGAGNLITK